MEEFLRAMPNHLARSSLFAPIARGSRTFHNEMSLVTRIDATITYTGEQLDEADADLAMQLIFEARRSRLGQPVTFTRATLLKAMGRSTGNQQYKWLHRRMKAMTVATLFIEAKNPDGSAKYRIGDTEPLRIIQHFRYDANSESYTFTLDPRWASIFANREFALIDWAKRLQMRSRINIAKAMQRLLATSADRVQRHALDWLKDKMQYSSSMTKFKAAVSEAMSELERLEIVATWSFERSTRGKEQIAVWLPPRRYNVPS